MSMLHGHNRRFLLVGAALALAGLTAACESAVEREMRLEREALKKSGELEELEGQLNTTNPDPYAPSAVGTRNIGRSKQR
jgi:hypothetical protein